MRPLTTIQDKPPPPLPAITKHLISLWYLLAGGQQLVDGQCIRFIWPVAAYSVLGPATTAAAAAATLDPLSPGQQQPIVRVSTTAPTAAQP